MNVSLAKKKNGTCTPSTQLCVILYLVIKSYIFQIYVLTNGLLTATNRGGKVLGDLSSTMQVEKHQKRTGQQD